jgi:hypothetical protein
VPVCIKLLEEEKFDKDMILNILIYIEKLSKDTESTVFILIQNSIIDKLINLMMNKLHMASPKVLFHCVRVLQNFTLVSDFMTEVSSILTPAFNFKKFAKYFGKNYKYTYELR